MYTPCTSSDIATCVFLCHFVLWLLRKLPPIVAMFWLAHAVVMLEAKHVQKNLKWSTTRDWVTHPVVSWKNFRDYKIIPWNRVSFETWVNMFKTPGLLPGMYWLVFSPQGQDQLKIDGTGKKINYSLGAWLLVIDNYVVSRAACSMFPSSWQFFTNSGDEFNGMILMESFTCEVLTNGNHA